MSKQQKRYGPEQRKKAEALFASDQKLSAREVGEQLGVSASAASYWLKQYRKGLGLTNKKGNGVDHGGAKSKKSKAAVDPRIGLAMQCLREARRLIEKGGGRQSKVELYSLLALKWLEGE